MKKWILAAVAVTACAALALKAQKADEDLPAPIKVDVNLVNVLCSVHDKHGGLISNLSKEDFHLFEDGKEQPIKFFSRETDLPLTIGLLVDVSRSQENLIGIEKSAADAFFHSVLKKKDVAFLISFGADSELLQDVTGSPRLLRDGLDQLRLNGGFSGINSGPVPTANHPAGTVLYDAVYLAASDRMSKEVGRKVIVLITDGDDQGSRLSLKEAVEAAQKADSVIYSFYYVDTNFYMRSGMGFGGGGEGYLKKMSDETGGRVFRVDRRNTLENGFDQLQQEMRSQYAIGFSSNSPKQDGSYHKIELRANDKDLKVQARKGYYAMRPEDK